MRNPGGTPEMKNGLPREIVANSKIVVVVVGPLFSSGRCSRPVLIRKFVLQENSKSM